MLQQVSIRKGIQSELDYIYHKVCLKKNEIKVSMKEDNPRGDKETKSKKSPERKPIIIAKREPLFIATNVIYTKIRSAVIKKNGICEKRAV